MKHFHFFDEHTGVFHGDALVVNSDGSARGAVDGHAKMALANCPPGHKPIEGHFDPLSQRVDVASGAVVDYQPEAPSADHQWNEQVRRWALTPEAAQRQEKRRAALVAIRQLEESQPRAVREALLGQAGAADRLRSLDERIAALRAQIIQIMVIV